MAGTNTSRWISLIRETSRQGLHDRTITLFRDMLRIIRPSPYVLPTVIRSFAKQKLPYLKTAKSLHSLMYRNCFDHFDRFISAALIDLYSKCGRVDVARKVFDKMPDRDLVVWNSIISGYSQYGSVQDTMELFKLMKSFDVKPDLVTWNLLVSGFSRKGNHERVMDMLLKMQANGVEPDVFTWTSIISGLVQNFCYNKAFEVFGRMVKFAGLRPNSVTISSILPACTNIMDLRRGRQVHGYAVVVGFEKDLFVGSSLLDMYAKCGLILDAKLVFDSMPTRNTVSYNVMIFCCSNHGSCELAIELFYHMEEEGVKPDHLTFTAVFTACGQSGKVYLGRNLFSLMQEKYQIQPRLEHYACIVDLLGRAGKAHEAYNFIQEMPKKPDSFVWGALLGACRVLGDTKLAELAASHLAELEPESPGSSLLLNNIFTDLGRWEDAQRTKKLMKKCKLEKYLGCSWTQFG